MKIPAQYSQVVLETPRLNLKEINPEIKDYIFNFCSDADIAAYFGLNDEGLAAEKAKFHGGGHTTHQISFKNFIMTDKSSGRILGHCGFHTWLARHSRAEVGYHIIDEADKNKGYMTEALKAMFIYGFEQMNLNRIEAFVGPNNIASQALVKRLGFIMEGVLREHYYKPPAIEDSICFSLLRREYDVVKDTW